MNEIGSIGRGGTRLSPFRRGSQQGFTLIEVLVALVLLSIFAVLAYGSYSRFIVEARRAEGAALLLEAGARLEQFMAENGSYTNNMTKLGFNADPAVSRNGFYRVAVTTLGAGGQSYTLTAVRTAQQITDIVCGDLTLTDLGVKSAINNTEPAPAKNCWE